jgi:glycosyltransferase involved in cell wall biosynthesis
MSKLRSRVFLAHPGRQHSHQAALALFKRGLLAQYWTGVPAGRVVRWFPQLRDRYGDVCLPSEVVKWKPFSQLVRKAGSLFGRLVGEYAKDVGQAHFNAAMSRVINTGRFDAVIGFETAAVRGFEAAKRRGIVTILDAASVHHSAQWGQDRLPRKLLKRRAALKDREVELADAIIVASTVARDSYVAAGVDERKIRVLPFGVDPFMFFPCIQRDSAPFTFVFAGNLNYAKGTDLLLNAFSNVSRDGSAVRLRLFGSGELERSMTRENIEWSGRVTHRVLAEQLRLADCFVLPSRFDSFGLVVAEGLASGVPAIVSDAVGARDLIIHDVNGWVFKSGDVDALTTCMRHVIATQAAREKWRIASRNAAVAASWDEYHNRYADAVEQILQEAKQ